MQGNPIAELGGGHAFVFGKVHVEGFDVVIPHLKGHVDDIFLRGGQQLARPVHPHKIQQGFKVLLGVVEHQPVHLRDGYAEVGGHLAGGEIFCGIVLVNIVSGGKGHVFVGTVEFCLGFLVYFAEVASARNSLFLDRANCIKDPNIGDRIKNTNPINIKIPLALSLSLSLSFNPPQNRDLENISESITINPTITDTIQLKRIS